MSLSFGNGALLWGVLLLVVPLLIHLLNRRRYRVVRWAAQEFLLEAFKRTRRRLTLESLLLLLLRCLLVVLLALALAQPFVPSSSPLSLFSPAQRDVVLVIDTSYSMGRRAAGGEALLERAKAQAGRVLDGLSSERGDQVTVVALADPPRLLHSVTTDVARAREAVERLAPDWRGADLVRTLDYLTENVLGDAHKEVYVLTDLQRETFHPGASAAPESAAAAEAAATPASAWRVAAEHDCRFTLVDVGEEAEAHNLAVEELLPRPENVVAGEVVSFTATVRNRTPRDLRAVPATFVIDGQREQGRRVTFDAPAGGVAVVECSTIFRASDAARANHTVEFLLEEDDLPADDRRFLAFPVHQAVSVLLVDGDFAPEPELRETALLCDMLNPSLDPETGGTVFRLRVVDDRRFNGRAEDPADYDLIVLANVARIDAEAARRLDDAVRAGRGLLVFLGDLVDARSYNERLHRADGAGLLPARLLEARGDVREGSDAVFFPLVDDFQHPLLRVFSDPELRQNPTSVPIRRFFRTEVSSKDQATAVIMKLNDDPAAPGALLLEKPAGRGRVVLFTTTADSAWAGWLDNIETYLPLMQETAYYLTLPDLSLFNLKVGDALRRTTESIPAEVCVLRPDASRDPIRDTPREMEYGEFVLPAYRATGVPGLYGLELTYPLSGAGSDAGRREVEHFAVNVDVAESDLARVEEPAFRTLYPGVEVAFATEIDARQVEQAEARAGELWRAMLWALVGLLAAEMALAWWFGRQFRGGGA
ncbi:MAG: VWA domain-containing protein [Planctomycetes bacterium]|nr:VWA domain-containing protein [Planctomycetota bacterium]